MTHRQCQQQANNVLDSGCIVSVVAVVIAEGCVAAVVERRKSPVSRALARVALHTGRRWVYRHRRQETMSHLVDPKGSGEKVEVLHWIAEHTIDDVHAFGAPAVELPVGFDSRDYGGTNFCDACESRWCRTITGIMVAKICSAGPNSRTPVCRYM